MHISAQQEYLLFRDRAVLQVFLYAETIRQQIKDIDYQYTQSPYAWSSTTLFGINSPMLNIFPILSQLFGQVVLDQIRTVDKSRLVHKLGEIDSKTKAKVLAVIAEIFAP